MPYLNQVTLIGHLSAKPEVRYSSNGKPVANFSMAVNTKFGEVEETFWARCTCFGGWAESAGHLEKGDAVCVSGRLKTEEWAGKEDGKKQSRTAVIANMVMPLRKQERVDTERKPLHRDIPPVEDAPQVEDDVPF